MSGFRWPIEFTPSSAWKMLLLVRLARPAAEHLDCRAVADWMKRAGRGVFADLGLRVVLGR